MKKFLMVMVLAFCAQQTLAVVIDGVTVPENTKIDEQSLTLNGAGVRAKGFGLVKVYIAALYVPQKTNNAADIIKAKELRSIHLHMLRDVDANTMYDSLLDGLKANHSDSQMQGFATELTTLKTAFEQIKTAKKDEIIYLDFIPNTGTRIALQSTAITTIAGNDFAAAMLSIWLGEKPVQKSLKAELLGTKNASVH
jgi:hypothetical protein